MAMSLIIQGCLLFAVSTFAIRKVHHKQVAFESRNFRGVNPTDLELGFLVRTASSRYSKFPLSCHIIRHGNYTDLSLIRVFAGLHKTSAQRLAGRLQADT